ncbi:histone-lysine n-methyltransferase [Phaffia rhodozyma]|uniref:Histone-lysine N-methyltransferase, H3 lysine-36 specific n=1 Tax=Phaffia rhodozyma TaxID=264483 RepID=A0A0F7ST83_PHARH|nr:histone-lysine n-methyltransferase [Phaffia rhodozyma]
MPLLPTSTTFDAVDGLTSDPTVTSAGDHPDVHESSADVSSSSRPSSNIVTAKTEDQSMAPLAFILFPPSPPRSNSPVRAKDFSPIIKTDVTASFFPPSTSHSQSSPANDQAHVKSEDVKPTLSGSASPYNSSGEASPLLLPTATTTTKGTKNKKKAAENYPTQLISHLPVAFEEASKTFVALQTNHHQTASLGRSHQDDDSMICDCNFRPGHDDPYMACGDGSDCINRLTQVECLEHECRCGKYCNNQRFTRRQYADVEVVMTEKKGFGLRAASNISQEDFIYEYLGEVVPKANFLKRMQAYGAEGIRHFYFMELQKDEYLDATKNGGIGRFINHSCNPNCFVAKWVVGKHMRMGIFAKRDILAGEELTFNYNVDRYGHDAQPCYCNEPNCVGTLGGKTQTDVGGMDDLYLDALGIMDEVEQYGMKGSRKKKSRKLDEDFMPVLRPISTPEVPKVVAAVRQSTANRSVLCKLLSRIKMTDDQVVQRQLLRMHGFNLMNTLLKEFPEDKEVVKLTLESMSAWPLLNRNKVEDSKIEEPVNAMIVRFSDDEEFTSIAKKLLEGWSSLPVGYRIAKRILPLNGEDEDRTQAPTVDPTPQPPVPYTPVVSVGTFYKTGADVTPFQRPDATRSSSFQATSRVYTPPPPMPVSQPVVPSSVTSAANRARLEAIIAQAKLDSEAAERAAEHAAAEKAEKAEREKAEALAERLKAREERKKRKRAAKMQSTAAAAAAKAGPSQEHKEKKYLGLIGQVVVRSMSKYKNEMDHDKFKRYAKECSQLILNKEKKSRTFISNPVPLALSEDKQAKMKAFTKEFTHKVLRRLKEARRAGSSSTSSSTTTTATTTGTMVGTELSLTTGEEEALLAQAIGAEMAAENANPFDEPDDNDDDDDDDDDNHDDDHVAEGGDTASNGYYNFTEEGQPPTKRLVTEENRPGSTFSSSDNSLQNPAFRSSSIETPVVEKVDPMAGQHLQQVMTTGAIPPVRNPLDDDRMES